MRAQGKVGAGARAAGRMPPGPGRLLCGEGHGEGDPDPGAAVQEPHHHRPGQPRPGDVLRHQLHSRAQVQDQRDRQARQALPQAQCLQRRHPNCGGHAGDGRGVGPGVCAAGGPGGGLCQPAQPLDPGLQGSEGLHATPGARLSGLQGEDGAADVPAPHAVQGGRGARHPRQCGAVPRARRLVQLPAEGGVPGADGAQDAAGDAGLQRRGRPRLLRQQAPRAGGRPAGAAVRGPFQAAQLGPQAPGGRGAVQGQPRHAV
mmetsp:Transcript_9755/g.24804  ORF Transcript_9755/g.24804 Transcript_9755/m.24804 type:complete len:259 (-) Transcript_9755:3482-4258(-)